MDISHIGTDTCLQDHRGQRQHRFMESSDINAAFRELFKPLRTNIRRGLSIEAQIYAIELDDCVPGQVLGASWIPPSTRGVQDRAALFDPSCRSALYKRLLAETRPEALFAFVTEHPAGRLPAVLYVEVVSADGCYAAEHPLRPRRGWHVRELLQAPARRVVLA